MSIKSFETKRKVIGLFYIFPSLFLIGLFIYYPVILSFTKSFTSWRGFKQPSKFIGLDNYVYILNEMPEFWKALIVNMKYTFWTTILQTIIGFLLGVMLYTLRGRWKQFFKVGLYLPVILPAATIGVMWNYLLSSNGIVNTILNTIGLESLARGWTADPKTALGAVIFVTLWQWSGFTMVLFYVSMLNIPKEVLEGAVIDGADNFKQIIYFIIPMTRNALESAVVLTLIGGMNAFNQIYLLTGGGPGTTTQVTAQLVYNQAFVVQKYGRALAMSVIIFAATLILSGIVRKLIRQKEE